MAKQSAQLQMPEDQELPEEEAGRDAEIVEIADGADWNVVERAFLTRRSIRKFKKKQVPEHLVHRMLEVGRFAPSQGNCQPYKFVVIREPELLAGMEEYCVSECRRLSGAIDYTAYPEGSLKRIATKSAARLFNSLDPNMMHPIPLTATRAIAAGRFMVFHRAPTVIVILMDNHGIGVPAIDIGIVGTNIIMAAHSYGLGTCWIGFSKLLNRSPQWRERLGVTERFEVSEAICLGYPVGKPAESEIERATHEIAWFENGEKKILG